jgi:apolipoprotein N-acyltransferase
VYSFARRHREVRWHERRDRRIGVLYVGLVIFLGGYSLTRLPQVEILEERALQAEVTVIQGNIEQELKWRPEKKAQTIEQYSRLTREGLQGRLSELVIWPETALPFYPEHDPLFMEVRNLARSLNIFLLTGAPRVEVGQVQAGETEPKMTFFNSSLLLDSQGNSLDRYDKRHLVPFGEYVPFADYLTFIQPLVENVGDFAAGRRQPPLSFGNFKLGVLICYESIFPDISRQWVEDGANLLVNISNDAWYGRSSAPHHSLAMAVLRAVENRRSLVRAANTGVSAMVLPSGRVEQPSELFTEAVLGQSVPLMATKTIYGQYGYMFGPACLAFIPVMLIFGLGRRR